MPNPPNSRLSKEVRERAASERVRIQTSMRKWKTMNETARLLGRGLGSKELLDRVARDVGTTLKQVHFALKANADE